MPERIRGILRRMEEKISERKSYAVLAGCFGFLGGVILHSFLDSKIDFFWIYNAGLITAVFLILFWNDKKMRLILLGAFFVIFGFARFDFSIAENKILPEYYGREMIISGVVADEPINKIDKQQLVILPDAIGRQAANSRRERILITTGLYPAYSYGERIQFSCKLAKPDTFSDFDYAKWLTINDIYGLCYWPAVHSLGEESSEISTPSDSPLSKGKGLLGGLFDFKNFLIARVNNVLHEPYTSFLSGLILGAKSSMPPALLENFRRAGLTHIIAISGWNISFLAYIFFPLFFYLRIPRGKAFYGMVVLIALYALLSGASASVVRAAAMGITLLLAQKTGRLSAAGRGLLYAVAIMFLLNPRTIYDAGFWLSCAATFGLVYFSPLLDARLSAIKWKAARNYASATLTAIIFTLPVSSYIFGTVSLWSIVSNLAVLPFVPPAFAASLGGMIAAAVFPPAIAAWFMFPAAAILNYIVHAADFFGGLPGFINWRMPAIFSAAIYAALIIFIIKKQDEKI